MPGSQSVQLAMPSSGATVPETHQAQLDAPDVDAYVPLPHGVHASLALSLNLPGTHATHASAPLSSATAPAGHGTHAVRFRCANMPRGQIVHWPSAASQAVPLPHTWHAVAPGTENAQCPHATHEWLGAVNVFSGQSTQVCLASSGTSPLWHVWHSEALTMICAAVQAAQTVRLGTAYVSGGHCMHAVAPWLSENVRPEQAWHVRPSVEKVPAVHKLHCWPACPMALPAGHGAHVHESKKISCSGQSTHCDTSATLP